MSNISNPQTLPPSSTRLLVWNTEWAAPNKPEGQWFRDHFSASGVDLICGTEICPALFPACGHLILGGDDWGYDNLNGTRRKVALWSRRPWSEVTTHDDEALPGGRIVSGVSAGIRYVGVCIPWRDAHVSTGRKDRTVWQDHRAFLAVLHQLVPSLLARPEPLVLLGDFNQAIPRGSQPREVFRELEAILDAGLAVPTAGLPRSDKGTLIDHVAIGAGLLASQVEVLPKYPKPGFRVSDHDGIALTLLQESRLSSGAFPSVHATADEPLPSHSIS